MAEKVKAEYVGGGTHLHRSEPGAQQVELEQGDVVELYPYQLKAWDDKFVAVDENPAEQEMPDFGEMTKDEVVEYAEEEYGIEEGDIDGSGADGNVLKGDWINAIRAARE